MTGADMYSVCSEALLSAIKRFVQCIIDTVGKHYTTTTTTLTHTISDDHNSRTTTDNQLTIQDYIETQLGNVDIVVQQTDFEHALQHWTPSVSEEDMRYYAAVQGTFNKSSA